MTLLLDLTCLCDHHTDGALDHIYKAMSEPPGGDGSIWDEHPSMFVRRLVELFTSRGLMRIDGMRDELAKWLEGEMHEAGMNRIARPVGAMQRWSTAEMGLVKLYLEALPPAEFSLDDWLMVVDYLVQRYLPESDLRSEAEWLSTRSALMGKVQANLAAEPTDAQADQLLQALPGTIGQAVAELGLSARQAAVIEYGKARCVESVVALGDGARHRMRRLVMDHTEAVALGEPAITRSSLQTQLLDTFGDLNRDWRRIAVTEAGEIENQGMIASLPVGARVKRIEQYKGACEWCRKIDGVIMTVADPADPDKDGSTQIWVGKTNVGRSAAPRKREGNRLVDRPPEERWHIAAGVQHPHCFISPNVSIYTSSGWRRIADIKVGDLVLTHKGRFRPVNWVLEDVKYTGSVTSIKISSLGKKSICVAPVTMEHPFLTERGWVNAGEIVAGDRLVALAKTCPTCSVPFVRAVNADTIYCSQRCTPRDGKNQFSTIDADAYALAVSKTAEGNRSRMRGMTVEQRRALTGAGRSIMAERGYDHLHNIEGRKKGSRRLGETNYVASASEMEIGRIIGEMGGAVELQHRIDKTERDAAGRQRYWWADLALPAEKIIAEIDGEPWHDRLNFGRDSARDADLSAQGWTVLRFDSVLAKQSPKNVAEEIMRVALNHSGEYVFSTFDVVSSSVSEVRNKTLYNFGVDEDESYIISRGVVVHNCRGTWIRLADPLPGDDPDFAEWLRKHLEPKK